MNWIKNSILVFLSFAFTLGIAEIFMDIDGRYDDQVNLTISEINTNKIWSRQVNSKEIRKHPDLDFDIEIIFDQIGARKSNFIKENKKSVAGVFGDSFTENRRIDNQYSFTEILNGVTETTHFVNFGVDGYGLEQNFQHWIDKRSLTQMDYVFYLFCANDLEDTYRVQIFDREAMAKGEVVNIANTDIPIFVKLVSGFHLTYLFIESYYKIKSVIVPEDELAYRLARRFTQAYKDAHYRQYDGYYGSLTTNFLGDNPDKQTVETARHFRSTLREWKDRVERSGGEFIVLLLPRQPEYVVGEKLIPKDMKIIDLAENNKFEFKKRIIKWNFNSDRHWNEYANLSAARSLNYQLGNSTYDQFSGQTVDKVIWDNYFTKIEMLYEEELEN